MAILDADKQGFLRSATSLIQTIGRCARHQNAEVFMYADKVTPAMRQAIDETQRRRELQEAYNTTHGITPETIRKAIRRGLEDQIGARKTEREAIRASEDVYDVTESIADLEREMFASAEALDFERAAELRDRITALKASPSLFSVPAIAGADRSGSPEADGARASPPKRRGPKR